MKMEKENLDTDVFTKSSEEQKLAKEGAKVKGAYDVGREREDYYEDKPVNKGKEDKMADDKKEIVKEEKPKEEEEKSMKEQDKEDLKKEEDEEDEEEKKKKAEKEAGAIAPQEAEASSSQGKLSGNQNVFVPQSSVDGKREQETPMGKSVEPDLMKSPLFVELSGQIGEFQKAFDKKIEAMEKSVEDRLANLQKTVSKVEQFYKAPLYKAVSENVGAESGFKKSLKEQITEGNIKYAE